MPSIKLPTYQSERIKALESQVDRHTRALDQLAVAISGLNDSLVRVADAVDENQARNHEAFVAARETIELLSECVGKLRDDGAAHHANLLNLAAVLNNGWTPVR